MNPLMLTLSLLGFAADPFTVPVDEWPKQHPKATPGIAYKGGQEGEADQRIEARRFNEVGSVALLGRTIPTQESFLFTHGRLSSMSIYLECSGRRDGKRCKEVGTNLDQLLKEKLGSPNCKLPGNAPAWKFDDVVVHTSGASVMFSKGIPNVTCGAAAEPGSGK